MKYLLSEQLPIFLSLQTYLFLYDIDTYLLFDFLNLLHQYIRSVLKKVVILPLATSYEKIQ